MGLSARVGPGLVGLDASIFIYLVEQHAEYGAVVRPLFVEADSSARQLVTSAVTLLAVLVVPIRSGDARLVANYERILTRGRGLRLVEIDHSQLRIAAELRARHGVRTPDALQLAAAIATGCTRFVTNDRRIPAVPGLDVVQLRDVA